MAFLWTDSFDHYDTALISAKYATIGGSPTIVSGGGRRGSQCIRFPNATATITTAITPSGTTIVCGASVKLATLAAQTELFSVMDGATVQMSVCVKTDGAIEVRRSTRTGTLLGTSGATGLIVATTSAFVELKALISTTVGTAEVRVNGVVVLTLTGLNNAQSAVNQWTNLKLLGSASIASLDIDDLYLLDGSGAAPLNTYLGDIRVDVCLPTAEGNTIQWTPLSGTDNALMVDEIPPNGDTDYNATAVVNNIDTLVVQNAPAVGATILAVQQSIYVKKTDSGTAQTAAVVRSGVTDYVQTTQNPTTSYSFLTQALPTDPNTAAAWTEANFNAAEFGYKRIA